MSDETTPGPDLHEQIAEAIADWAYAFPIASWSLASGDTAEQLAKTWADQAANAVLISGLQRRFDEQAAEIKRLRAGESEQPTPEGQHHTPAGWIHRFNRATAEQRLAQVEVMLALADQASTCRWQDHDSLKHQLDAATDRIIALQNGDAYAKQGVELSLALQKLEQVRTCAERWRLRRPGRPDDFTVPPTPEQLVDALAADCGAAILAILGDAAGGAG